MELLQFIVYGLLVPVGIVAGSVVLGLVHKRRRDRHEGG